MQSRRRSKLRRAIGAALALTASLMGPGMTRSGNASEIEVVSGGAFKQVMNALAAQYEAETPNKLAVTYKTVGQHLELIRSGAERFDVAVLTPEAIDALTREGKIAAGSRADLARTGIGVVVKAGAPLPDISTVAAFKAAVLKAKSVAYIDPKAGGSSGIYLAGLFERLGIADAVAAKAVLVHGGAVADHIADGEAELGIHQISEILPVKGVVLVGPLPAEIQNYTVYAAGVAAAAANRDGARDLVRFLAGPHARSILSAKGMEPPG